MRARACVNQCKRSLKINQVHSNFCRVAAFPLKLFYADQRSWTCTWRHRWSEQFLFAIKNTHIYIYICIYEGKESKLNGVKRSSPVSERLLFDCIIHFATEKWVQAEVLVLFLLFVHFLVKYSASFWLSVTSESRFAGFFGCCFFFFLAKPLFLGPECYLGEIF